MAKPKLAIGGQGPTIGMPSDGYQATQPTLGMPDQGFQAPQAPQAPQTPSSPRSNTGTSGSYGDSVNLSKSSGRDANIAAARNAGISQGDIDSFLASNPDDHNRLLEALQGGGGGGGGGSPAPSGTGIPSMMGLDRMIGGGTEGGGGYAEMMQAPGALREGLGRRIYPTETAPLAGLRRIY